MGALTPASRKLPIPHSQVSAGVGGAGILVPQRVWSPVFVFKEGIRFPELALEPQ